MVVVSNIQIVLDLIQEANIDEKEKIRQEIDSLKQAVENITNQIIIKNIRKDVERIVTDVTELLTDRDINIIRFDGLREKIRNIENKLQVQYDSQIELTGNVMESDNI